MVGFAVDIDAQSVGIYVSNVLKVTTPINLASVKPCFWAAGGANSTARLRTKAGQLVYTPPSGYTAWD